MQDRPIASVPVHPPARSDERGGSARSGPEVRKSEARARSSRGGRQVIPRPLRARPGDTAPWSALVAAARRGIRLPRVREVVADHHEALTGPQRISPGGFPDTQSSSAVLVVLFEEEGEARVVLTRRAAHLRTHTGEVSFPGGRLDAGEAPEDGALREAAEEVGLDPHAVELVGRLSQLSTFSSWTTITPVVGVLESRPALRANPHEVERVFDVSLAELASEEVFREERWELGTSPPFPVWFFELPDDTIWGATARVLVELLRLVLEV
jgi:8-oxo-dGTP pyrophosphatase MutT (NUDIX family)